MSKTVAERFVEDRSNMRLYQQERAIYDVTELLEEAMEKNGISRAELAALMNRTKGWVTQLLDGQGNKTIRTVADAFAAMGQELQFGFEPIEINKAAPVIKLFTGEVTYDPEWIPQDVRIAR